MIQFAEEMLGFDLLPWQKWLLIHMLELLPDNSLRFRTVVVLIARQNGKSTLSAVLALWGMYVYGFKLTLGTAQDLDTADEVWQKAVDLVTETDEDDQPVRPELYELFEKLVLVNGKKSLNLRTGERYKVKAANRRAGRGLTGDLVLLDELREHQSWDAWGAITKTTMARTMALILALSNAGDASSIVLRYLRKMAHAAVGDPDGLNADDGPEELLDLANEDLEQDEDTLGIFEWSAPPGCSVHDRDGWAMANPSLGHTITERTISSACRTDPEWVFRTEVLCQWSDGALEGPFPTGSWESGRGASEIAVGSPVVACVDVSWNRSWAYIVVAGDCRGGVHVEVVAQSTGTEWVVGWFTDEKHPYRREMPIAVQANSAPVSSLADALEDAGLTVIPWQGSDLGKACGQFYDLVVQDRLKHLPQPILDVAAATSVTRPLGDAWIWDRKNSPHDAAPLMAATGAAWALTQLEPPKVPPASPLALDDSPSMGGDDVFDSVQF